MSRKKPVPIQIPTVVTEEERQSAREYLARIDRTKRLPAFKDGRLEVKPNQFNELCKCVNTDSIDAAVSILEKALAGQSLDIIPEHDKEKNTTLLQIAELKPESYLESMLISQMIQVNTAVSKCMYFAFHKDQHLAGKELNLNLAVKMHRTFVAQIEALQKLRGKGGQKVTVEHVHVHDGGQAIVGNVNQAPGGGGKNE